MAYVPNLLHSPKAKSDGVQNVVEEMNERTPAEVPMASVLLENAYFGSSSSTGSSQ